MESIILCTIFGVFILLGYTLGLKSGQKLAKGEEIKLPEVNPIKKIKEARETSEEKKKQEALDIMMANIENYDGTSAGQKDIPDF